MAFKKTWKGRVVYKRKKNVWKIKNVINILIRMNNDYPKEDLKQQAIGINSLKQIVDLSFYPIYAKATKPVETIDKITGSFLSTTVEQQFKILAADAVRRICAEVGIPSSLVEFLLDILFEPIWQLMDKVIDTFTDL